MSLVSTSFTACQFPSACMIARLTEFACFLETVVGKSEVDEKGWQDGSLWNTIHEELQLASFVATGGKGEAAITNQLHDQVDHVSVR